MMRLAPRTLFARMVLVLLGGLIVAQFLSLGVLWRERGEFMVRAAGMYSTERIAEIVKLLDATPASERARIVGVINSPPLRVTLAESEVATASAPELASEAADYEALLKAALGAGFPLKVSVTDARRRGGPGPGPGMMRGYGKWGGDGNPTGPGPGAGQGLGPYAGSMPAFAVLSFVVQTRLTDGTAVTFDARQPQEPISWSYRLLISLAVMLVAVFAVTLTAVRWMTRPLKTLAAAAVELGDDINRPPLDERGPLEVSHAARAFNAMQAKLAALIRDRTRIFSAMSHDLKTPITRLRLRTELLDDAALREKFAQDLKEMEEMVGAALDFMRGVDTQEAVQSIDMLALIESIAENAREVGGDVNIEGTARAPYPGHPQSLKRCLTNLVDNAVKYGKVAAIALDDGARELRITVSDGGPGVPESELERVFEPFYRVEASRNRGTGGSGLGLTIARNIARAHGGDLVLKNRAGGGLEAVLTLPRRG
jgi:signal transduction histidine kinase